jgi:hypothetical protein
MQQASHEVRKERDIVGQGDNSQLRVELKIGTFTGGLSTHQILDH